MQPTRLHYFFAQDWPFTIWIAAFTIAFSAGAIRLFGPAVIGVAAVTLIGLLVGFLTSLVVLPPLYRYRARINGAPFRKGDTVRILRGRHRGTVAEVYEVWHERGQFRVDLGEAARKEVKDVFTATDVLRE
ncbi:MAG TPA: hypothetical protein VJZ76_11040 [Thermoanaerobaculia bacterium]|nr:hypothetical protein [Thermoanaerobaculia bacterium]